jgi:hypothetical protein
VPTGMLYGTVVEYIDISVEEMQSILVRLIGHPRWVLRRHGGRN